MKGKDRAIRVKRNLIVAISVLVIAGLVLLAGCSSGLRASKSQNAGNGSTGNDTLGVPIYPGAQKQDTTTSATPRPNGSAPQPQGQQGSMPQGSMPQPPNGSTNGNAQGRGPGGMMPGTLAVYTTADSADQVIAWYRDKLKSMTDFQEMTPQAGSSAPSGQSMTSTAVFSVTVNGQSRTVMVRPASNGSSSTGGTTIIIGEGMGGAPGQQQNLNGGTTG
jgi:hypothetical protein